MLTIEQVIEKYKDVELKFSSYYKYCFDFVGTASDGAKITATLGGDGSDIYREYIKKDDVRFLQDIKSHWNGVYIKCNDEEIFSYSNY